jgi:hypothetical protein
LLRDAIREIHVSFSRGNNGVIELQAEMMVSSAILLFGKFKNKAGQANDGAHRR